MPRRAIDPDELASIEAEIASKLPPGLSDEEFDRVFGPAYEQALGIAENSPAPLKGSAMSRALSGLWQNLNPVSMAQGLAGAVRHPIDTLTGMAAQSGEQLQKAKTAPTGWEKAGYAASAIPVIGPLAAQAGEAIASGDLAGGLGQGAGLVAPFAASAAMRARVGAQAKAGTPALLEAQAVQQVADKVLAPGNVAFKGRAQTAAKGILDRGLTGSRDALREAADLGMQEAGGKIDAAINAAGGPKAGVAINPIVAQLERKIADLSINGQPIKGAEKRVAGLRARIDQMQSTAKTQPPGMVQPPNAPIQVHTFEDLRRIRDEQYRLADEARAYMRAGKPKMGAEGFAAAETGSAIRQHFGNLAPDLAAANADYTFFKTLGDVLDPAQGRPKVTTPTKGVTGGAATAGAVVGSVTGSKTVGFALSVVKPWIEEMRSRPEWQLASAQDKLRLAEAIRAGNVPRSQSLMAKIAQGAPRGTTSPTESRSQTTAPALSAP